MTPNAEQWLADSLDRLETKVDRIDRDGCAQREGDLRQLVMINDKVSDIKKELTDDVGEIKKLLIRIYWAIVVTMGGLVSFIAEQWINHKK